MSDNRADALAALTREWQTTAEVTAKMPESGRSCMRSVAYSALRKLVRDGLAEMRYTGFRQDREWRLR